jgi:hypothetical protein
MDNETPKDQQGSKSRAGKQDTVALPGFGGAEPPPEKTDWSWLLMLLAAALIVGVAFVAGKRANAPAAPAPTAAEKPGLAPPAPAMPTTAVKKALERDDSTQFLEKDPNVRAK